MDKDRFIDWYIYKERRMIKFVESFYSDKIKKDIEISFVYADTSSCMMYGSNYKIYISKNNLKTFLDNDRNKFAMNFYNILMHEIGHALYTDFHRAKFVNQKNLHNVFEDNRIERIISQTNKRVNFDILRKILIDANIDDNQIKKMEQNPSFLGLGLSRAYDKTKIIKHFSKNDKMKELLKKYFAISKELTYMEDQIGDKEIGPAYRILQELCNNFEQSEEEQEEQRKEHEKQQQQNSDAKDTQEESSQDEQDDKEESSQDEQDTKEESSQDAREEFSDEQDAQEEESFDDIIEKEFKELINELSGFVYIPDETEAYKLEDVIEQMVAGIKNKDDLNEKDFDTEVLTQTNQNYNKYDYKPFNISLLDYVRQKGIKGTGYSKRPQGNARQLDLKSYSQRNFTKETKHFNKNLGDDKGNFGKIVNFYIDASGSMYGYHVDDKINSVLNYVKNFYDKFSNDMEINLRLFGDGSLVVEREHLQYSFFQQCHKIKSLGSDTIIRDFAHEGSTIVLTDGSFSYTSKFERLKKEAFFIIVYDNEYQKEYFETAYKDVVNKVYVSSQKEEIVRGFEEATQSLRRIL